MIRPGERRNATFIVAAALSLGGCLVDSIQPWLGSETVMAAEGDFAGAWEMVNEDGDRDYAIKLEKDRSSRSIEQQRYYIKVSPRGYDSQFNFSGVVHEVNGIKLLEIRNFTHFHDEVFGLANRPTISLWQIAYDDDNIILWGPGFLRDDLSSLKTMQDSDEKLLFIDSTENLKAWLYDWTSNYPDIKDQIEHVLPILLTRAGTEFEIPAEFAEVVPQVYENLSKTR